MKLFALIFLLILIGASGFNTALLMQKTIGEFSCLPCGILMIFHLVAACLMVSFFFDSQKE